MSDGGSDFVSSLKDADARDRMGFVKKVYSILLAQLLLTGVCIAITITSESICWWMVENWWVYIIFLIVALIVEIMVLCIRPLARKVPVNYILLFLFTLCESYLVAYICMVSSFQYECQNTGFG